MKIFNTKNPASKILGGGGSTLALLFTITTVGLAVPAYGQGVDTSPDCSGTAGPFAEPFATGHTGSATNPIPGNPPADPDPSSLAAGCNAVAETDGSVAIGDGATVMQYDGQKPTAQPTRRDFVYLEGATDTVAADGDLGMAGDKGQRFYVRAIPTAAGTVEYYYATEEGSLNNAGGRTKADLENHLRALHSATVTADSDFGTLKDPDTPATVAPSLGGNAVAIGTDAVVVGQDSVAIGEGAKVGKPAGTRTITVLRADTEYFVYLEGATDTVAADGDLGMAGDKGQRFYVRAIPTAAGTVEYYYATEDDRINNAGGRTKAELENHLRALQSATVAVTADSDFGTLKDPDITTTTTTELIPVNPAARAVAVGADSSVTGDGGVAIGAGASAAENGIAIGAGVEAGADEIRIGGESQTNVRVGAYDLDTITDDITDNGVRIDTNVAGISANAGNIATNAADIETNTAGIATAVALAGLPVFKGGTGGWGIALGSFEGETAVAIGANYNLNQGSSLIRFGISTSSGGTSGTIGFGKGF